jgi:type IV secretory pathway VirB6-like protein
VSAQANGAVGCDAGALRTELEEGRSRRFLRRFTGAQQESDELKAQIIQFRRELAEVNAAAGQRTDELTTQITQLRSELDAERSRRFLRRFFGIPPRPSEETEKTRERMRGRLAIALVAALVALMALTFVYLLILSRGFGDLTTDDLIALIPMVGTTLLTPLVGLIGAVMGFYYGGQTAVSAATQTAEATKQATQSASHTAAQAASSTARQLRDGTILG